MSKEFQFQQYVPPINKEFILTVNYNRSIERMIANNYDHVNDSVKKEHFPLPSGFTRKKIVILAKLFNFINNYPRSISTQEAIAEIQKDNFRPSILLELLTFGFEYPDLQRQFSIIALGSINFNRSLSVAPYLFGDCSKRKLGIIWSIFRFYTDSSLFLAVRDIC